MDSMDSMRDSSGITLIELMIVVSIVGILVIALGFSYHGWQGKYKIESATKDLYADLMDARTRAMTRNRMYFVRLTANSYSVYADTNDNTEFNPGAGDLPEPEYLVPGTVNVKPKPVEYSLVWTGDIGFDTRGIAWEYTDADERNAASVVIRFNLPAETTPDYDCITLDQIWIRMGRMTGGVCVAK